MTDTMNPKINKKLAKINKLQEEIRQLQDICLHENFTGKYGSDTGNWCPDDNSYWITARCSDCGKRFNVDSKEDTDLYRILSLSGKVDRF